MPTPVTYGDAPTVSATGSEPGQIQFSVDGVDVGAPVATDATAAVPSPALVGLTAGGHTVGAALTPTDTAAYAPSTASAETLTIEPAPLTITASSPSILRGSSPSITPSFDGFVAGESSSSLATQPTCTTTATATSAVGTYPTSCTGAVGSNYTITYVDGTASVGAPTVVITAPSITVAYGAPLPTLRPTYSGFVASDGPASLQIPPTCTTTRRSLSVPGKYPVVCSGATSDGYQFRYVDGLITVVRATPRVVGAWRWGLVPQGRREVVIIQVTAPYGVVPTGVVRVRSNGRLLVSATLYRGRAAVTLPLLPRGRNVVDVTYQGSAVVRGITGARAVLTQLPLPPGVSPTCASTRGPYAPSQAWVSGLGLFPVVRVGNDGGAIGSPPTTQAGVHQFGWYIYSSRPGSGTGGVVIDAHTWYGHDALGNQLLARLAAGGRVILYDSSGWAHTCYTVTLRREYPVARVPVAAMTIGPSSFERLSIMVCSGVRTVTSGVTRYSTRTIWWATAARP